MNINTKKFIQEKIQEIKNLVGKERAVVATSGGVDSFTCMILGDKALKRRLVAVTIDTGLMREKEPGKVAEMGMDLGLKIKIIRAQKTFFQMLKGIEDPEEKRIAFREAFYQTLGKVVKKEKTPFLIQGTIKADIIETQKGIKTQHNVLEQIGINAQKYGLSVIEPLRGLYKPEVRNVARVLGLPKKAWNRMPFPGPGLALRIIGEVTPERVKIVRRAHVIVEKELARLKPFQCFAVLLNDKATGMKNGKRVFGDIIIVRSVESKDAMIAKATKVPWKSLEIIQRRITSKIPTVVKVLFDITPKPPSTIEYI